MCVKIMINILLQMIKIRLVQENLVEMAGI
jgi:hypothetical protein